MGTTRDLGPGCTREGENDVTHTDVSDQIRRLFYIGFTVCFVFVLASALFRGVAQTGPERLALAAGTVLWAAALYGFSRLAVRYEKMLEARFGIILAACTAAMFLLEFALALTLRHDVWFDAAALFDGAAEWVETGSFPSFYEYYGWFPNNLGGMAFLYVFFKAASLVSFTDWYAVAALVNSALLTASMTVSALTCRNLAGTRAGILALGAFALSPQFCFLGGAVYTDTLSMLFPSLIFYLYLLSREARGGKKLLFYLLIGLAAGIGGLIKITVVIMVIALVIDPAPPSGLEGSLGLGGLRAGPYSGPQWGAERLYVLPPPQQGRCGEEQYPPASLGDDGSKG